MNELFTALIHQPIFNLLVVFYRLFSENLGLSIIAIALLSRIILIPLALKQSRSLVKNQEFAEKVKEIKAKYKNDKQKQQEETMKIQSEYLPAQLAGCLPLIVQFILLITINNVFLQIFTQGSTIASAFNKYAYPFVPGFAENYVLNTNFLGIDLNVFPSSIGFGSTAIIPYVILILVVGITQYYSAKVMQPKPKVKSEEEIKKKSKLEAKENPAEDFSETLQRTTQQTLFLIPILIMATSYTFAAGLSLYWIIQSAFVIIQQYIFNKLKKPEESVSK